MLYVYIANLKTNPRGIFKIIIEICFFENAYKKLKKLKK
jgi:hypothetical protein